MSKQKVKEQPVFTIPEETDDQVSFLFTNTYQNRADLQFSYDGEMYTLKHGRVNTLPRKIFRHLQTECIYPVYESVVDDDTKQIKSKYVGSTPRFGMQVVTPTAPA